MNRRRFLSVGAVALCGVAGCGSSPPVDGTDTPPDSSRSDTATSGGAAGVGTELVADGFTSPTDVVSLPGSGRLLVADQPGKVYAVGSTDPLLDLSDRLIDLRRGPDERGLLGLAAHPDFTDTRRLFVRYSAPPRPSTPSGYSHTFVLAEFHADVEAGAVDDERILLEIPQPQPNHNAGAIAFGPDGSLYVGVGDGGGGGDVGRGHATDWYDRTRGGNGQDLTANLLGSVLRLDVDGGDASTAADTDAPYAVPPDNPLVGRPGLDEQWAWGFRNPWRFSFDGDALLVADVGQARYEEINRVESGGNYGWNVREGPACFAPSGSAAVDDCPDRTPAGEPLRDPVVAYPHPGSAAGDRPSGVAVVGGYRYDGDVDALDGRYVFADWQADGRLFLADPTGEGDWPLSTIGLRETAAPFVTAFGRGESGELYVLTSERSGLSGSTGACHRLVA
jgi:glucose/arabinose dehydrogenase